MSSAFVALGLMFLLTGVVTGGLLLAGAWGGAANRKRSAEKERAFECGNNPIDLPHGRFSVKFYLVALLFILFDVELTFLFPWAVVLKPLSRQMGFAIFMEMFIYLLVIAVGLVYAIKKGALEWD
ncbi:MAG: NADH-quinone oxidoreductase subunit A [Acidobacteria bacterium]|nr:NADH-quinone oxidoreductase subunit A [Acidobacteriota bacterium]MBI3658319.1 NADH-quinone oxidoreductase subunit A [Acidobacteriota bacterium]